MGHNKYEKTSSARYNMGHSAEVLVVTSKGSGYSDKCRYCQNRHWSDKCMSYKTAEDKKETT